MYEKKDLLNALEDVGVDEKSVVFMHSSLLHLGRSGVDFKDFESLIFSHFGDDFSLCVPTFSYSFCKCKLYHYKESKSENLGSLTEILRLSDNQIRLNHPIQSISILGKIKNLANKIICKNAFFDEGIFGELLKQDAKLLFLGASIQAASLVHYSELRKNVAYRYKKEFSGICKFKDDLAPLSSYELFVRDERTNPMLDLSVILKELKRQNAVSETRLGNGLVFSVSFKDFVKTTDEILENDEFALVNDKNIRRFYEKSNV